MGKLPAIVVLAFALALAAGGVIGVLAAPRLNATLRRTVTTHLHPLPPPRGGPLRVPLGRELNLAPEQEAQMREIWEATRAEMDEHMRRRETVKREWEAAVQGLLTQEQKARFDQLRQEHQARLEGVDGDFESIFRRADDKTRQILDAEQRKRFEDIRVERSSRPGGPPGGPGGPRQAPRRGPGPGFGPPPGPPPHHHGPGPGQELRLPLEEPGHGPRIRITRPGTRDG